MSARKPSLLFINQHYYPDLAATAQNLTDLCEYLADLNHEVHVISSQGLYQNKSAPLLAYEKHNKVHIHRVKGSSFGRDNNLGRMIDYVTFLFFALLKIISLKKFDAVCTLTTPPMLATLGSFIKWFKQSKHIIWSMDLHPDAEVALGMLPRDYWITDILLRIHRFNFKKADLIVSLGPYMTERIVAHGVPQEKIREILIWSNKKDIHVEAKEDCVDGLPNHFKNRFIVQYSGNLGLVHEFETMCEVMREFSKDTSIGFVFNGEGPRKKEVTDFIRVHHLTNVALLTYVPIRRLSQSLGKADLHWLSLRDDFIGMAVPGKCIGYMASGRPQLFIGSEDSDNGNFISDADAGYIINPGDVESIKNVIQKLQKDPETRKEKGFNGRKWFLENAETKVGCELWAEAISELFEGKKETVYA